MNRLNHVFSSVLLATFFLAASPGVIAKQPFWPDAEYDDSIPTLQSVLGHKSGEKISNPREILQYLDALVVAAPKRVLLVEYATSWQGRKLKYLVISSPENMANLADNQAKMQQLVDPRQYSESERANLIDQILPVSWMSYGVHGDEISSSDAALLTAYHLLASQNDTTAQKILNDSIVVIDPSQNPDGRARFVAHFEQNLGLESSLHQLSSEHEQAWPGGRTNHYLFDMNRDWFAQTQPETIGRIKHYQKFHPVVHADVHEMGVDQSYYFPPPTAPYNPHISEKQKRNLILYGKGNAAAFDDYNFDYFTREIFDAHYAGYGDTWPAFHGAIGMTFEASSARGLRQSKTNGEIVTYRSGVHRHFVASMATLLTTATHGERLLTDLAAYRAAALEADENYLFTGDVSLQRKLMSKLEAQGIEVHQFEESSRVCGKSYQAGDFIVRAGQPAGHLVRTLLDADSPIEDSFWQDKEKKRELGLSVSLYDVLAWSMPALYGLDVSVCRKEVSGIARLKTQFSPSQQIKEAAYGFLVANDTSASMQFLASALRANLPVHNVDAAFSIKRKSYARGTLLIKTSELDQQKLETLHQLSRQHQVSPVALNSSWTDSGINFGSGSVAQLTAPKIALAWGEPTYSNSAGSTRFVIERQLGYPVTTIRTASLSSQDLQDFDVLILPDGGQYAGELGANGLANVKDWVARGGILITFASATKLLMEEGFSLLESQLEANVDTETQGSDDDKEGRAEAMVIETEADYLNGLASSTQRPDYVPGVIAKGVVDKNHWLSAGVSDSLYFVLDGSDVYTPLKQGSGTNVVRFEDESDLLHGGYLWQENREQLAYKPVVMSVGHGRGGVVAFVIDPTLRGYMEGFHVILANALFKASSR